jgi:hypothetical protein
MVYLCRKVWDYLLIDEVTDFLKGLEPFSYTINRPTFKLAPRMSITFNKDEDAIMFKILFAEYM